MLHKIGSKEFVVCCNDEFVVCCNDEMVHQVNTKIEEIFEKISKDLRTRSLEIQINPLKEEL